MSDSKRVQTTSAPIFPPRSVRRVPPQPVAAGLEAGKSAWALPPDTRSLLPSSPAAQKTLTPSSPAS